MIQNGYPVFFLSRERRGIQGAKSSWKDDAFLAAKPTCFCLMLNVPRCSGLRRMPPPARTARRSSLRWFARCPGAISERRRRPCGCSCSSVFRAPFGEKMDVESPPPPSAATENGISRAIFGKGGEGDREGGTYRVHPRSLGTDEKRIGVQSGRMWHDSNK